MTFSRPSDPLPPKAEWDRPPWNRWSFQHVRDIVPTVEVWCGNGPVRLLTRDEQNLERLKVRGLDGEETTFTGFLNQSYTDGLLVLRRGAVVCERYFNDMDEQTLHLSQSVAKSFTGALTGILVGYGIIDVTAQITDVLPELHATAYRGATVQHVLDMVSGVRFTEDYTNPSSDMARADVASGWKPVPDRTDPARWPRTMFELILSLRELEHPHGDRFAYRSIETDVLAFVLERAAGRRLPQLLSEQLWQKLGMERSANMTVDPAGYALADGGLNACLRDYARFAQMILENGADIVPAGWIDATRSGDHALFREPYDAVLPDGAYRNQFWIEDSVNRNLLARGVCGQLIHIDFARQIVVVKLSSWPEFVNAQWTAATLDAVRRIGLALS